MNKMAAMIQDSPGLRLDYDFDENITAWTETFAWNLHIKTCSGLAFDLDVRLGNLLTEKCCSTFAKKYVQVSIKEQTYIA